MDPEAKVPIISLSKSFFKGFWKKDYFLSLFYIERWTLNLSLYVFYTNYGWSVTYESSIILIISYQDYIPSFARLYLDWKSLSPLIPSPINLTINIFRGQGWVCWGFHSILKAISLGSTRNPIHYLSFHKGMEHLLTAPDLLPCSPRPTASLGTSTLILRFAEVSEVFHQLR